MESLEELVAGHPILVGGDRFVRVSADLAAAFRPGDALAVVPETGEVLHIPCGERRLATGAIDRAVRAFERMATTTAEQVDVFYEAFATALESESTWSAIAEVNARDVEDAKSRGRSTTRLLADGRLRIGNASAFSRVQLARVSVSGIDFVDATAGRVRLRMLRRTHQHLARE